MKKLASTFIGLLSGIVGKKNLERFIIYAAKSIHVNLHQHALIQIGAGTSIYLENGSEALFIKEIIAPRFENEKSPIFFDVGANIGNYTLTLKEHIKDAEIYSFEPIKETFEQLVNNVGEKANLYNLGLGSVSGTGTLYNNSTFSEITTTYKDILTEVFNNQDEIVSIEFKKDTIDNFCATHNIKKIDFLKIDVEGGELSVLQGASKMIADNNIQIIQFEFNSHNVYARVFLRDFYLLLKDFNFYRLNQKNMMSLGGYSPVNEIFTAQNIVAMHKTALAGINSKYLAAC